MIYPFIITTTSATVLIDGKPEVISAEHPNFEAVKDCLREGRWDEIQQLINVSQAVSEYAKGKLLVADGVVTYAGTPLHNTAVTRLLGLMKEGFPVDYLVAFLDNVCENPDARAVEGLYSWLEKGNLPLSEDGHIIAYKIINNDYTDVRTGAIDNSVGAVCEMPRFLCDGDPDRTCSTGLHFCSAEYLPHYGSYSSNRVVLVKINPRDVVAFPRDYNISKGRCCRYQVVEEIEASTAASFFEAQGRFSAYIFE